MKNLKSKLLASVAMLIVSGIMLTSASFAWFTISTAPEISNIHTTVTANGNLEIALDNGGTPPESTPEDAGKNETWGNLVDLAAYFNAVNVELKPVDVAEVADTTNNIAAGTVRIPTWGLDGRISGLETADVTSVTDGSNYTDLTGLYIYTDGDETNPVTYALRVDFWLRSNVGGKVILTEAVDRGPNAENDASKGLGSYLEGDMAGNISVAFQPGGTGTLTKATLTANAQTEGIYDLSADAGICTLTENVPQKVSMYIYMDGADLKNKDFLNEASTLLLNVQFALDDEELDAMDVTASGSGRDEITLHTPTDGEG